MAHLLTILVMVAAAAVNPAPESYCTEFSLEAETCQIYKTALAENDGYGRCQGRLAAGFATNEHCRIQARFVAYLVKKKVVGERIGKMLEKRRDSLYGPVYQFKLENAPVRGATKPQVTLIEFFDFECYYCYRLFGVIDGVLAKYPEQLRLYHKMYPLSSHPNSELVAAAALAANDQNHYWDLAPHLFVLSEWTEEEILSRVEMVKLDKRKIKKAIRSPEMQARVSADRDEGRKAGVKATPTVYLNGRQILLPEDDFILSSLIDEVLAGL